MDNFPKEERFKPERPTEGLQQFSYQVTVMEEELVGLMEKHMTQNLPYNGFLSKDDKSLSLGTYDSRIKGIGIGYINVSHYVNKNPTANAVGVSTDNVLRIFIHTDTQTMSQVKELHEKNSK